MAPALLEKEIARALRVHCLAKAGDTGLVCVSGGSDSLAVLHLLHAAAGALELSLEVVHFDHGLRPESAGEAHWVGEIAHGLGLPFHLRAAAHLADRKKGVQAAAREWRLAETGALLRSRSAAWAATGHQRDDQTETVLLKLLRGCHLAHIRGMDWRAGPYVRPALGVKREALREYLRGEKIRWLEDPSNHQPGYKRNRVRIELIPLLDDLTSGSIGRRLETVVVQSRQLADMLSAYPPPPQNHPGSLPHWVEADAVRDLPRLAGAEILHRFVQERLPGEMGTSQIEAALALLDGNKAIWELALGRRRYLKREGSRLLLEFRPAKPLQPELHQAGGWEIDTPPGFAVHFHQGACGKIGIALHNLPENGRLQVRPRQPGDRFHPPWRKQPVKVKDFLRDQHIPLAERNLVPLVVWEAQVIAVYPDFAGVGFDQPTGSGGGFCLHLTRG